MVAEIGHLLQQPCRPIAPKLRGFERGLAGGGWRPTAPKIQQKFSPRIVCSPSHQGSANRALPLPLGRGVWETKSQKGCFRHRKSFMHRAYSAQRGIETMVSEGARQLDRGRFGFAKGGIGKRMQKRGRNLCYGRDFLAPTPSVRQPLIETSDKLRGLSRGEDSPVKQRVSALHP